MNIDELRSYESRITALQEENKRLKADVLPVLSVVIAGYVYDPGSSDLDDEQPIHVGISLGAYRRASRLKCELETSNVYDLKRRLMK